MEPWGAEIEGMGSEWMEGEALEARSVDSPFDEFHGEVKKGERTCTEEGEENVLGHLGCVFVCLRYWKLAYVCRLRAEQTKKERVKM